MPTKLRNLFLALALLAALSLRGQPAQPADPATAYRRVLEDLFAPPPQKGVQPLRAVLLFQPSFGPEQEIILGRGADNAPSVTFIEADRSIWQVVGRRLKDHLPAASSAVAAEVHLRTRQHVVDEAELREWLGSLLGGVHEYVSSLRSFQAASSQPFRSVIVDGVHYRLSLLGLQTQISVEVTSLGTLDQGMEADPVARTMRRIRQEAIREVDRQ